MKSKSVSFFFSLIITGILIVIGFFDIKNYIYVNKTFYNNDKVKSQILNLIDSKKELENLHQKLPLEKGYEATIIKSCLSNLEELDLNSLLSKNEFRFKDILELNYLVSSFNCNVDNYSYDNIDLDKWEYNKLYTNAYKVSSIGYELNGDDFLLSTIEFYNKKTEYFLRIIKEVGDV